ncbi:MAG: PAS domain S-box protein [Dehalococcoidia bacterium]|jgi:PAS domain-containing protein/ActR/RegA family two-component response regulator
MSLKTRLLIAYACFGIGVLVIVGGTLFVQVRNDRTADIEQELTNQLVHLDFALTNLIEEAENDISQLSENEVVRTTDDEDFTSFLNVTDPATFEYNIGETEQAIIDILNAYRTTHPYVNSVYMGRENGTFVRSHPRASPTQYDPRERPWYIAGKENPGQVVITEPYESLTTTDVNIGVVTALIGDDGEVYGVVGADITLNNLTEYMAGFDVGYQGRMLLTDEYGTIVAFADPEFLFENVEALLGDADVAADMMANDQGYTAFETESGSSYLYLYTSPELGWKLAVIVPANVINKEIQGIIFIALFGLFLALAALIALAFMGLNISVIRPLRRLNKVALDITHNGDLNQKAGISSRDEVGTLAASFDRMTDTLRDKAESLQESEARYADLYENAPDMYLSIDPATACILRCNQTLSRVTGYAKDEIIGKPIFEIYHPDCREEAKKAFQSFVATGEVRDVELKLRCKDGRKIDVSLNISAVLDASGKILYSRSSLRDITERKKLDAVLQESEERFKALLESSLDVVTVLDARGTVIYQSPNYRSVWGREPLGEIGKDLLKDIYPDDIPLVSDSFVRLLKNSAKPIQLQVRALHTDGTWHVIDIVEHNEIENPAVRGVVVNFRDVTERKRVEEALRESEQKYRLLADNASDVIILMDMNAKPVFYSSSITRLLGYSVEEALTGSMEGRMPPASIEKAVKSFMAGLDREKRHPGSSPGQILELEMIRKDGSIIWTEMMVSFVRDSNGEPTGIMGIIRDVTQHKRAEEALRESEEKYSTLVENATDGVTIIQDQVIKFANKHMSEMSGYTVKELTGMSTFDLVPPDFIPVLKERFAQRVKNQDVSETFNTRMLCKDGTVKEIENSTRLIQYEGKPAALGISRDITERKRMEEALRESEEWHRALVETSGRAGIGIAILQSIGAREAAIVFANDQACVVAGYSQEELLKMSLGDVIPPDIIGKLMSQYRDRQQGKNVPYYYEAALVRKDKTRVPVITSVATMKLRGQPATVVYFRDITESKRAEAEIIMLSNAFRATLDPVLILDMGGNVINVNEAARKLFERDELGVNALEAVVPEDKERVAAALLELITNGRTSVTQFSIVTRSGRRVPLEASGSLMLDASGKPVGIVIVQRDLTERKQAEGRQKLAAEILGSLNEPLALQNAVNRIMDAIKRETGFYAVGIRLRKDDDFPYFAQRGFTEDFLLTENTLVARGPDGWPCRDKDGNISLECTCGLVLSGKTDPSNPLFTPGGSAWTNDSTTLLDVLPEQDTRLHPRNRCIQEGFQSVAIIPIRSGKEIVGLLQLNDRRKGCFTPEMMQFFEGIAVSIGVALARRRAEEMLLRINKAVEGSSDAIGMSDPQGHHFYHNKAFTELFEYTPEELEAAGGGTAAFENKNIGRKVFETIMGGGSWSGEVEMVSKSGRKFTVLERADAIKDESGKVIGLVGVHTDITESKRALDKLRETRDYMENLIEHANVPMVVWTPDFRITRFNRAFERLTGMKAKSVIGKNLEILFPEKTREKSMSYVRTAVSGARWEVVEIPIVNVEGTVKTVLWNISTIYAEDRKTPIAIIAQGQDITERKQAEEALKESEEMARGMLDNAAMGIYLLQNKKFLYVNPTFEKIMGYTSAELVGQEAINYVHPGDRGIVRINAVENLKGVSTVPYEFRSLRKDGKQIWVMERVTSIKYKGHRAVIASFMETTEHRKAELELELAYEELKTAHERMVQSEKLRAMGEMASGIAHDFNNMLAVILGRTQLVIDDVKDDKVKKGIQIIEQAALDAAKTVKRLQDFARIRVEHPFESLDVNEVVEGVLKMVDSRRVELEQTKGITIKVEQELGKVGQVSGDAAELREALLNILFNAMDAMPTGGKLMVKSLQDEDWVQISIKDTGVGIPDKVKSRIFEPFFTTKASKGSGLGLSVTYGIIARHGGMIKFDSAVGKGTTFYIRLPLATEAVKQEARKRKAVAAKPANILTVDDEVEVLKALGLTLEYFGHWVKGFTSGAEAVKAFKDGNYDLVITDLGMPGMSGWDVARAIKKIKPDMPVLLITGWVIDLDEEQKKLVDGVIAKPFSRDSISSAISQVFPAKKKGTKKKPSGKKKSE